MTARKMIPALLGVLCAGCLTQAALAATGYVYDFEKAASEKASHTLTFQVSEQTLARLQDGGELRLVPQALAGQQGRLFGALSPSLDLSRGKVKANQATASYNARKQVLKYAAKGPDNAPFLIFDGVETASPLAYGGRITLQAENALEGLLGEGDVFLLDRSGDFSRLPLVFQVRGKKLLCSGVLAVEGREYAVKAVLNTGKRVLKLTLKSAAGRDCLCLARERQVDLKHEYALSQDGYGHVLVNPVGEEELEVFLNNWVPERQSAMLASDERLYMGGSFKVALEEDLNLKAIFMRHTITLDHRGEGDMFYRPLASERLELFFEPAPGWSFACYDINGRKGWDNPALVDLEEDAFITAYYTDRQPDIAMQGLGTYCVRWQDGQSFVLSSPSSHFQEILLDGQPCQGREVTVDLSKGSPKIVVRFAESSQLCYDIASGVLNGVGQQEVDYSDASNLTERIYFSLVNYRTFRIGSQDKEYAYSAVEARHDVSFSRLFYIAQTEMTQGQLFRLLGLSPATYKDPTRPVESVAYSELRGEGWPLVREPAPDSILGRLRQATGLPLDIPTEAQWETACRFGGETSFNNGTWLFCEGNAVTNLDPVARYCGNVGDWKSGFNQHTRCARYLPNRKGIYDMHGNVAEWCRDWYGDYDLEQTADPEGPSTGIYRVVRGGSWNSPVERCRAGYRDCESSFFSGPGVGFRLMAEFESLQ